MCTCGQTKTGLFENADTQFQSTLRNIRADLFKMADGRFPFLSFILGLISNIIACFQANLALLILHADYSRGAAKHYQVIHRMRVDGRKRYEWTQIFL